MPRSIKQIASEISREWKNVHFGAEPYLNAMFSLENTKDMYGQDTASGILCYFLVNAGTFRGGNSARLKAEIKELIGRPLSKKEKGLLAEFNNGMNKSECTCGNSVAGFDCTCGHTKKFPGNTSYSCEFDGIFEASKPRCNKCEAFDN